MRVCTCRHSVADASREGADNRFCFPDARWSKQKKTPAWPRGLRQSEFATPHCGDNSWQRVGLAADFARQERVQFVELGELYEVCRFVHPRIYHGLSAHVVFDIHQHFAWL